MQKPQGHSERDVNLEEILRDEPVADHAALERAWEAAGIPLRSEPSDEARARVGSEIWAVLEQEVRNSSRPARARQRHRVWRWSAVAATLLVAALSGLFYLRWETTVTAPAGERLTVTLPDGSSVELNSGASLTYAPRIYGWSTRTTTLEGEAFFEVVSRESEFITRTFNAEVRVLGTSFNVRAWPDQEAGATVVALSTGTIRFTNRVGTEQAVVLRPGEMSRVDERNAVPSEPEAANLSQATAWRSGRFVFVDEPLSAILEEMERRFDVSIEADAGSILGDRLTLAYDDPTSAEAILADIASSYSRYRYRRISDGYELYVP